MQIDWLTVAAQIVNFLALVWLLQRFLYRPITTAMARREARIAARLSDAAAARDAAEAEARRLEARHAALDAARDDLLAKARAEAEALRARLEADLHAEIEARRAAWRDHLRDERADVADRLRHGAGRQVIDVVGRVLRDLAGGDLGASLAGVFADRLAALDPETRDKLARAAARADGPAQVHSHPALTPEARDRITRAVRDCLGADVAVDHADDADLVLGVRLTVGAQTVEWSAARFLHRLETTLDETIEGAGRPRRTPTAG